MNSTPLLEACHLHRSFGERDVVADVSFNLLPGNLTALLGTNGSGKSTLFKLLTGLLEPSSGEARVYGVSARTNHAPRDRVASMIDRFEPPSWASPKSLFKLYRGVTTQFDVDEAQRLLALADLRENVRYGHLSKGQRRWVLAVLVLASRAPLMLLDEPADGMDPAMRRLLYDSLRHRLNDGKSAAIVATHVLEDIERVADDVLILKGGECLLRDPLEALREEIREVLCPSGSLALHRSGLRILAETERSAIVRHPGGLQCIQRAVGERGEILPVSLERLFLVLTSNAAAPLGTELVLAS